MYRKADQWAAKDLRTRTPVSIRTRAAALAWLAAIAVIAAESLSGQPGHRRFVATGPLDDPAALPGQIIVAGPRPGYLKYNGGGPAYLAGPDNPEDFFFRGDLNPDGTRSGDQQQIIDLLAQTGVNAFHALMFRMRRCNFKGEGDDTHTPFIGHDPAKGLNKAVLDQWDKWIGQLEDLGVALHLEFYNDATDVELMGWTLDAGGNLHPDEQRFITGIVNRFKHRKNILWGIAESANKASPSRTRHFQKIAEVIARTDNHNHPVVQSFVTPNDPDEDFPKGGAMPADYAGDPHIRVVTWLHVVPHGDDFDMHYNELLFYRKLAADTFIVMKNETFDRPYTRTGNDALRRRYTWCAAMAGLHSLEAGHNASRPANAPRLREDAFLSRFMEQTDYYRLRPRRDLAAGSTKWVLANPGSSYIAYTYSATGPLGLKGITAGTYDLVWLDTINGASVVQKAVRAPDGEVKWTKPASLGEEVALYVTRTSSAR